MSVAPLVAVAGAVTAAIEYVLTGDSVALWSHAPLYWLMVSLLNAQVDFYPLVAARK